MKLVGVSKFKMVLYCYTINSNNILQNSESMSSNTLPLRKAFVRESYSPKGLSYPFLSGTK